MPQIRGNEIGLGIALGSALLFGIELARILKSPGGAYAKELSRSERRRLDEQQTALDAFVTLGITFTAMGASIQMTVELVDMIRQGRILEAL